MKPQLFEDLANVLGDCVLGEYQLGGDLAVRQASPDEGRNFVLAPGERG
jgi:hypothetical protein